jgi:porin
MPSATKADCDVPADGVPEESLLSSLGPGWAGLDGVRPALAKSGVAMGGAYYAEMFGNPLGGFKQGTDYDGVLELNMDADMRKLGLWNGLCFHANGFQIHSQGITANDIGGLMPVSSLEATPATRLDELWFEQHMLSDKVAVKFGQLAADTEFIISQGGGFFLNSTWGWPSIATSDLPSGGPAYPLATPGVRVGIDPSDKFKLLIGVYNGDPAGPNCRGDPQVCNNNGLDFRLDDPPLVMVEGAYKYNQNQLAGTIKIGGWNHFGNFPRVSGSTRGPLDSDYSLYAIIDQIVWRVQASKDPIGVALFARVMGAPSDRNLVDFYADGGLTFSGVIRKRPDDSFAIGIAYTGIDVDFGLSAERSYQALVELCYTMQLASGLVLQPDLQYLWQPDGDLRNESDSVAIKDALVLGVRSSIKF